ncbi:MAG: hypothetical protein ACYSWP_04560, partial [Planctomycetota bacterium]
MGASLYHNIPNVSDYVDWRFQKLASGGGGSGDVAGPTSSTDNAIVTFDGTTGKLIQESPATVDDSGNLTALSLILSGGGSIARATNDIVIENTTSTGEVVISVSDGSQKERLSISTTDQVIGDSAAGRLSIDQTNQDAYLYASGNDYIHIKDDSAHHMEFYVNSQLSIDIDDGSVDLYNSGTKTFATAIVTGVYLGFKIGDFSSSGATDATTEITQRLGELKIDNAYHNGYISFVGENSAGAAKSFLVLKYTGTAIYNAGVAVVTMTTNGMQMTDQTSYTKLIVDTRHFIIRGVTAGEGFRVDSRNLANTATNIMIDADPDDGVGIYHAGNLTFGTAVGGVFIGDTTLATSLSIIKTDPNIHIKNNIGSGWIYLLGINDSAAQSTMAAFDPDAGCKFYHDGVETASTFVAGGIQGSGMLMIASGYVGTQYGNYLGNARIYGWDHGSEFDVIMENDSGAATTVIHGDPEGWCGLYYQGSIAVRTQSQGISSLSTSATATSIYWEDSTDTVRFSISTDNDNVVIATNAGGHYTFKNGTENLLFLQANGPVILYYDGSQSLVTKAGGFYVFIGTGANWFEFLTDGTDGKIYNYTHGGLVTIEGETTGGAAKTMLSLDPDGGSMQSILYGMSITGSSAATYFEMIDPEDSGQYTRIGHSGDSSILDVYTSGASTANWTLTVDNGTTQNNIIVANYLGVSLYYSNASVFEVTVRGCSVKDPAGGQSFLRHNNSTNVFEIVPYNANAGFTFFVTNGSYVAETAIKGNANGSVDFYYDNLLAAKTAAEGFSIYDTSGDDPTLWFIQDDGSTVNGFIEFNTTGFEITDSILSDIMISSVSGIFSIYYLGTKTVDVTSESINLYSTDWPGVSTRAWGYLSHNGTVLRIDNQYTDGTVTISSRLGTIMTGSTASGVALYYATGNRFETKSGGVQIKGSAGNIYTISPTATETTLLSATTASHIVLSAGATAGGYNTMIDADPDGSVALYYLGGKVLSTISSGNNGIEIIDTTGRQEWMYWNGNEFLLHTLAAAATLKIILRDGAGTNKTVAQMASTGPIFYGNNVKVLDMRASTDGGIRVYNSDGLSYTEVIHDGTDSIIRNRNNSNSVRLQADNSANTPKDLFVGNGDDSSGICYAGDIT